MPALSKIRFTNVIYENGAKRYNDDTFLFDGHNGAILLENGGGKTVFIQTVIQAILPHSDLAERKIKETLSLEGEAAHIAIEWILNEKPRRYAVTAITLFTTKKGLESIKYVYEYEEGDKHSIDELPFVKEINDKKRPATKDEINEHYQYMKAQYMNAKTFDTIKSFHEYIEENFKIIPSEWRRIATINSAEGGVEAFFDNCKTTGQLVDNLLIPSVEEAIAGNGNQDFIKTFEKQRDHFKRHKQLREQIEESKLIEQQINNYVEKCSVLHNKELEYMKNKEEAKTIYSFIKDEETKNAQLIEENELQKADLELKEKECERKLASYNLAILKAEVDVKEKSFQDASEQYTFINEQYIQKAERLQNLEIAKLKKDISDNDGKIAIYQAELNQLDMDKEIVDLQAKLAQNSAELKGCFTNEESKLNQAKATIENKLNQYNKDIESSKETNKELNNKLKDSIKEESKIDNTIEIISKSLTEIENKVLDNPLSEKVEDKMPSWQQRLIELEENKVDYNKQLHLLSGEKDELKLKLPQKRESLSEVQKELISNENLISNISDKEREILLKLKELNQDWYHLDSLYLSEASIRNRLEERVEKLRNEKEQHIFLERLTHRFFDDYNDNNTFSADPIIDEQLKIWKKQFNILESGTIYVQRAAKALMKTESELFDVYPYWPIVLITSDNEKAKLTDKVNEIVDKLTYPVLIISGQEARDLINNVDSKQESCVFPTYWRNNINQESFLSWKSDVEMKAKEAKANRLDKEREFKDWDNQLTIFRDFVDTYPHQYFQELTAELRSLNESFKESQVEIASFEDRLENIDNETNEYRKKILNAEQESSDISNKVTLGMKYKSEKVERETELVKKEKVAKELERLQLQIERSDKRIEQLNQSLLEKKIESKKVENNMMLLKDNPLYREVREYEAVVTDSSIVTLEEARNIIKDSLNDKQRGRALVEEQLKNSKTNRDRFEAELTNLQEKVEYSVDESFEFPMNGEYEIKRLIDERKTVKKEKDRLSQQVRESEKAYDRKKSEYSYNEGEFYTKFNEIVVFANALEEVIVEINKEKEELARTKEYLLRRADKLAEEDANIKKSITEMDIKNGKYEYLNDTVKEKEISIDNAQEIPYMREKVIERIFEKLAKNERDVTQSKDVVDTEQRRFKSFCENNIKDVKSKEMAVKGIEYKETYQAIVDWQKNMQERINRIIKIAEDDIKEHDRELQQYINHLHSYLHTISEELKIIPRKTRVKVDDSWKEIFIFNVPEWNEDEGKEELRKHIDWLIIQLDSTQFKDEEGNDDQIAIKNFIEKHLQTKQLFSCVTNNNTIKVKCRKVTNDGNINSMPKSWENSNKWSGGEKWSKNMTLYLGILNYVAEKKQHISPSQKRNRTVIVDNPFGKASSDHVLDPVFFIAEQLGFQIIALTALGEGKFIRDYFPIVYSCKLRSAVEGDKQILTKEKEIRHAFFKDNDPRSLERLGEVEQIALF